MYSVVLLAALTASGQTPDCHRCGGASYSSCNGGCYGSGWGGCHGGCYGSCYGSCYGNYGIDSGYGGCYGSCGGNYFGYSGTCWGGAGCSGGCYGSYGYADYSSSGCNGCMGSYGAGSPYFPMTPQGTVVPSSPVIVPDKKDETLPLPNKKPGAESLAPSKAKLIVEVPAGAKLYIDDQSMRTQSERRVYQTPTLAPGQTYFYEVRVEVTRDGIAQSKTKRVLLRAGQEVHADFKDMETTATAKAK
jgi:uncharacterized protein (TIGR03000 family)